MQDMTYHPVHKMAIHFWSHLWTAQSSWSIQHIDCWYLFVEELPVALLAWRRVMTRLAIFLWKLAIVMVHRVNCCCCESSLHSLRRILIAEWTNVSIWWCVLKWDYLKHCCCVLSTSEPFQPMVTSEYVSSFKWIDEHITKPTRLRVSW